MEKVTHRGANMGGLKLRYDGKYDFMPVEVARQWTILSHFVDANGQDRFRGSFSRQGLVDIGALKGGF